jgi:adenosylcobyric acid synthase
MKAKTLMVQGTASSVGKSILVAALCHIFYRNGYKVAPFKAQNMALNSFVTEEGGEIGRAQAVQAEAAGIDPSVHMNPVLLKPEADAYSQLIVQGKVITSMEAGNYYEHTHKLLTTIEESLNILRAKYDLVIIEGAGSPAEINLKKREIANMRIARMANAPVLLTGDIDRGGVFASLVGTLTLLSKRERMLIQGIIINKFRGNVDLLKPGLEALEKRVHKPVLGVIPYIKNMNIAQEDSVFLDERPLPSSNGALNIAVVRFRHISNYDDFDPLEEYNCNVHYITKPSEINSPDLIILPGTKKTVSDLLSIQQNGLWQAIQRYAEAGTPVMGICGGFQMLGARIVDPLHIESKERSVPGLGLLDNETVFCEEKTTNQIKGHIFADNGLLRGLKGLEIKGYEIHMGRIDSESSTPVFHIEETQQGKTDHFDGIIGDNGHIFGTFIHGIFHNPEFTLAFLNNLRSIRGLAPVTVASPVNVQSRYDRLADVVSQNLDIARIESIIKEWSSDNE